MALPFSLIPNANGIYIENRQRDQASPTHTHPESISVHFIGRRTHKYIVWILYILQVFFALPLSSTRDVNRNANMRSRHDFVKKEGTANAQRKQMVEKNFCRIYSTRAFVWNCVYQLTTMFMVIATINWSRRHRRRRGRRWSDAKHYYAIIHSRTLGQIVRLYFFIIIQHLLCSRSFSNRTKESATDETVSASRTPSYVTLPTHWLLLFLSDFSAAILVPYADKIIRTNDTENCVFDNDCRCLFTDYTVTEINLHKIKEHFIVDSRRNRYNGKEICTFYGPMADAIISHLFHFVFAVSRQTIVRSFFNCSNEKRIARRWHK